MADYQTLRATHAADFASLAGEVLPRVRWSAERLAAHRRTQLRRLVRTAQATSPWHRGRLRGIDAHRVEEHTLAELPTMTKHDLMANFDEIVTDDRLRLDVVEAHLESLDGRDAYLFDRYHACGSSGSSGRRGVLVYDWDGWSLAFLGLFRYLLRTQRAYGGAVRMATLGAGSATHQSSTMPQTFSGGLVDMRRFPVTLPVDQIVAELNDYQPTVLNGYPAALYPLTHAASAGELRIAPRTVVTIAEPLLPEIRDALERTWSAPVLNVWGASEGASASSCGQGPGLHLSDDLIIVEPVDRAGDAVAPGERAAKIYLTVLFNHAMPLIRYEITDELTVLDARCPCGSAHRLIADPQGRMDDTFHYGDVLVHPHLFRAALGRRRDIIEYQVHQTADGAHILARCQGPMSLDPVRDEIQSGLAALGVARPTVTIEPVGRVEREPGGKLRRFRPLVRVPTP